MVPRDVTPSTISCRKDTAPGETRMHLAQLLATTATSSEPFPWWFPVVFVGMWLAIANFLGWMAGHMTLLARFPPAEEEKLESFWASAMVRGVSYRSALYVGIGRLGLHMAPTWLFRPLTHRGIPCIPWDAIRCTLSQKEDRSWLGRSSRFEIPQVGLKVRIYGKPGRAVEAAVARAAELP